MSEDNPKTVDDETKAAATPPAEGTDARGEGDEFEAALREFDSTTQPRPGADSPTPAKQPGTDDETLKRVAAVEKRLAEEDFHKAITPVVAAVRGEIPKDVLTDEEVLDWMEGRAKRDPRLQEAWINRAKNPQAWGKVQAGLGRELAKKFAKQPDPNATEDRDAVAAAVRAASTRAPEGKAPDYSRLNNAEYREQHFKDFGYYPSV